MEDGMEECEGRPLLILCDFIVLSFIFSLSSITF